MYLPYKCFNWPKWFGSIWYAKVISCKGDIPRLMLNTVASWLFMHSRIFSFHTVVHLIDGVNMVNTLQERNSAYLRRRSLADHIGNSCIDDTYIFPDKLSEDILRCICSIYCKLGNPTQGRKGFSVSSNSSLCSSSTLSPRNLSGSWSPQCTDEASEHCDIEGLKQDNGPYAAMVEVLKICLDDESYSYAATMLQKFRSVFTECHN